MEFKGRKLSQREKVLLILVAVAAVSALFYFCIYKAQIDKMASIRVQLEKNQQTLNTLKGFDGQLKALEKDVDKLDKDIELATKDWFPSLRQDVIIKDLESKVKATKLNDTTITFKSSEEANIADFNDKEKLPSIAEALTLSFVTLMQDQPAVPTAAPEASDDKNLIEKAADALAAPTPTPGPDGDETTTAFAAQAGTSGNSAKKDGELDPAVQAKLDALKKSLSGLTEKELKAQIEKILANTDAKVDKLEISVSFKNSSYRSIMDFVNKVEKTSPNIYVTQISYTDSTDSYIGELQNEVNDIEERRVAIENKKRQSAPDSLFQSSKELETPRELTVKYTGVDKYNGSITLVYFAVSKIHSNQ